MSARSWLRATVAAICIVCAAGCGGGGGSDAVTVFAAASLKSTFTDLGAQMEKDNPGTQVAFNFAGSSDLVTQLTQGGLDEELAGRMVARFPKEDVAARAWEAHVRRPVGRGRARRRRPAVDR